MPESETIETQVVAPEDNVALAVQQREVAQYSIDGSRTPDEAVQKAADEAGAILKCIEDRGMFTKLQGGKHLNIEAWQMIASYKGCIPREVSTEELPDGSFLSRAQLVRVADGAVVSEASMSCGDKTDGPWGRRPKYAKRSMAITRAYGKVCRMTFGYIAHMAGYKTTPAEEMPPEMAESRGPRPASKSQIDTLRKLADSDRLSDAAKGRILKEVEDGLTQRRAGALIARTNELIQEGADA
jgi:hypothetical protein